MEWKRIGRGAVTSGAVLWSSFMGLTATLGLVQHGVSPETLLQAGFFGVLAAIPAPWYAKRLRGWRRGRNARRAERAARRMQERLAALPPDIRPDWQRLIEARELVTDLAVEGLVSTDALVETEELVLDLERVLALDERTDALGGRPSGALREQVRGLADLLVALADEAVDHRAAMTAEAPAPATLDEARERLATERTAMTEVRSLLPPDVTDGRSRDEEPPQLA